MTNVQHMADLPIDSKVKMGKFQSGYGDTPIEWRVVSKDHWQVDENYPVNAVSVITDKVIYNMCFDAKEPDNADENRKKDGNNRYRLSNIRQWLNSTLGGNHWYTPQNINGEFHYNDRDQPPSQEFITSEWRHRPYTNMNGFATMFRDYELDSILPTKVKSGVNKTYDYSPTVDGEERYDLMEDKFFLPSVTELGFGDNPFEEEGVGIAEGATIAYFADSENRKSQMERTCFVYSKYNQVTSDLTDKTTTYQYMTRSAKLNSTNHLYTANTVLQTAKKPNDIYSLRPMCNIDGDTLVSTTVDDDGCYTIIADVAPVVEIVEVNLLNINFNVYDMKGYPTEVKVYYNGVLLNTFTDNLTQTLAVAISYDNIHSSVNEIIFKTKDNANLEGTQVFKLDFKDVGLSVGNIVSGKNETFKVTDVVNNDDGTSILTVDRNLKHRINAGRNIERLDFNYIPHVHVTEDYHSIPSYLPMEFKTVEYNEKMATESWELDIDGVYNKTKIAIKRDNKDDAILLKTVSQIYKFKDEM